ncbi:MAG: peptidoglycan bridge formation glycyltransferase FemA/FemB family protein [Patescibacteria group bacterium]|jgi:lipid II:glycine glycyltransferase (peptidoglycan interpeptide bridge formation enzyme)
MFEVKQIDDKIKWNNFLLNQPTQTGIFLQSAEWLDFQENFGHKIYRLGFADEKNDLKAICGVIQNTLPFGKKYLYIPRGPISAEKVMIDEIKKIAQKDGAMFLKIEPLVEIPLPSLRLVTPVQPKQTLILDLAKSEEELLAAMHEKTRYNIRLAEKKNLILKNESLEDFWKLMEETTARDKFHAHPKKYYESMLEKINGDGKKEMRVELRVAYFENHPVAAAIIGYFGDTVTYLHGASSYEYRNLMAPYFLHWEIIKEAKKLGYKFYDFWGIDEKKWPGVTRFKKGFGGFEINYPGTFDLPINKIWYKIYNLAKKIL